MVNLKKKTDMYFSSFYVIHIKMSKSILYGKKQNNQICTLFLHFSLKMKNMTCSCLEAVSMFMAQPTRSTS